jgi:hypothetical protein
MFNSVAPKNIGGLKDCEWNRILFLGLMMLGGHPHELFTMYDNATAHAFSK